jgi:phage-related holin
MRAEGLGGDGLRQMSTNPLITASSYISSAANSPGSWLSGAGGILWSAVANPTKDGLLLLVLGALFMLDLITGLAAAWVTREPIKSHKLRRSVGKLIGYFGGFVTLVLALLAIEGPELAERLLISFTLAFFCGTEALSVVENCARMGVKLPPEVIAWFRGRLRSEAQRVLDEQEQETKDR